ncbi:MAG TPA: YHS domain-containing protein [Candidatus Nitrosotenuis sp.]|nr:YHS domain-containing protein [Candidatus Nitrosotenuis sp.]
MRQGAGPEPVVDTVEYQGKTYPFCQPACKEEFLRDPQAWVKAAAGEAPAPAQPSPAPGGGVVPT